MSIAQNIVFRHYRGDDPCWEAYGIALAAYGSGGSLSEAKQDVREALAALLDVNEACVEIDECHEHCIYKETDSSPAVWVRTFHDHDPQRMLKRREIRDRVERLLDENPGYLSTFDNGISVTGDVVATVALEDDMLMDILEQVGDLGRLFVCMPVDGAVIWQCITTKDAEDRSDDEVPIASLNLGAAATIAEFMQLTEAKQERATDYVLA